jgi:hypothetical protein
MFVEWYCGFCKKNIQRKFNLSATQEDFVITEIRVFCDKFHYRKIDTAKTEVAE